MQVPNLKYLQKKQTFVEIFKQMWDSMSVFKTEYRRKILLMPGNSERVISPVSEHFASESVALMVKYTDFGPDGYSLEAMGENKIRKSKEGERSG